MALQILIQYRNYPVTYEVTLQEEDIYHLRLSEGNYHEEYIPQKFFIRRKGKIWISDLEDYRELVNAMVAEIENFQTTYNRLRA
jgi:hypothetical protein